jgi:hypothetical protein
MQAYFQQADRLRRGLGLLASALIAALILVGSTASRAATISGSVVDDSGTPLAGAIVDYRSSPTAVRDQTGHTRVTGAMVESSTVTAKDGTFSLTGLPPSVYWLCAEGTQTTHIRSCDWGFGNTKIDLTTAPSVTNAKLQVHDGVTLTFQVNDARNQIKDFTAGTVGLAAPGNFRIFVVIGAWLRTATPVSVSGTTRQYAVLVPKSAALRILLDTRLTVLNQAQVAMAVGNSGATIAMSGQPVTYNLTVQ